MTRAAKRPPFQISRPLVGGMRVTVSLSQAPNGEFSVAGIRDAIQACGEFRTALVDLLVDSGVEP